MYVTTLTVAVVILVIVTLLLIVVVFNLNRKVGDLRELVDMDQNDTHQKIIRGNSEFKEELNWITARVDKMKGTVDYLYDEIGASYEHFTNLAWEKGARYIMRDTTNNNVYRAYDAALNMVGGYLKDSRHADFDGWDGVGWDGVVPRDSHFNMMVLEERLGLDFD